MSCAGHKITAHRGGGRSARPLLLKEPSPWVKKPELEKQTSKILPITAEMRAAYEKHDKEWQESKYAKNMPLANARIFSRMSDEEKAELPESIHNYLFMYYEQNKERIKQDEEEQNTRDILGYIPGIGSVAEGISAYHAFEKGSIGEGFLYAVGSVPVGKYAVKGGKVALKSFRKVPRRIFKAGKVARNAKMGDKLGKIGEYVEHPGTKVNWSKYAKHGSDKIAERGMTKELCLKIVVQNMCL
ncbi:MAG: hypothetical protein FWH04_00090 [Oscillospiraceae bacterium]|nr:hypothetical protein [Oscillospiraceae bacterium]